MTSSFILSQLEKRGGGGSYSLPGSPLGGMEDAYIKLQGNCHPDFITIPIGRPNGVKQCVRKPGHKPNTRIGDALHEDAKELMNRSQGYHRASPRLYDPHSNFPVQEWNPQYYSDRRMPWEQDLLRKDYQRWPMTYSGTGIHTLRAPAELRDKGKPYY